MAATSRARTHSALASPSRVELLDHIRSAGKPLDAHRLADECGLHVTTVRFHLDALINAGLLTSRSAPSNGRGRPRLLYEPVSQVAHGQDDPYVELSRLLVTALNAPEGESAGERAEAAGYSWAVQSLGAEDEKAGEDGDAAGSDDASAQAGGTNGKRTVAPLRGVTAKINALFTELGFESDYDTSPDDASSELTLHACPFDTVAKENPAIVCRIHLGLLRGALDHLGLDGHTARVEPWVTPTACKALVGHDGDRSALWMGGAGTHPDAANGAVNGNGARNGTARGANGEAHGAGEDPQPE